jgi:hypothetical protein
MQPAREETMKLITILLLCVVAVGCGYGSQSTMPASPGTTPIIAQLSPSSVVAGSQAFMLTVMGSSFGSSAFVTFNGAKMTTAWTNSGQVTASIPQSAIMNAGTVPVTVTNPAVSGGQYGGGTMAATSTPMNFTID